LLTLALLFSHHLQLCFGSADIFPAAPHLDQQSFVIRQATLCLNYFLL
jgi:hypothetical protein